MKTFLKVWIGIALLAIGFGIAVVILAVATGDFKEDIPTYSLNESYDGVQSIVMNISYAEVDMVEGTTFSVDAEDLYSKLDSYVSDGTWYINLTNEGYFDVFGMHISLGSFPFERWGRNFQPKIKVTVPKGFVAESFRLEIGAAMMEADNINAIQGDFTVEAGRLLINQIAVSEESVYHIGAGEMILKDAVLKDTTMDVGVGSIELEGVLTGDNDMTCGVGRIKLALNGEEDDYSYDISAGIGAVDIDGDSYHSKDKRINNASDNNLKLDCGIGNITVDFD